jgi:CDP-paratose 2-epimerase
VRRLFERYGSAIKLIVHTAAQPSHDWAARAANRLYGQGQRHTQYA